MAQLEGSEFDFSDLFVSPAIPSGMFGVVPGYDPSASEFFGPNVQRFIEILRGYFEDQDQDDIDRILRQGQIQKFIEVLRRVESGDATIDELKAIDVSDLAEMPGWSEYYSGVIGEETDAGETEEETKTLQDYIDEFGEDVVNTAQGIYDDVGGFIEGAKDDPLGTLVSILDVVVDAGIPEKCQDLQDCKTANPDKGTYCWKDCVNFSILTGIPGLPSLPGMQDVGTYRDFEEGIKGIGKTIGDVLEGNAECGENNDQECTVAQVLEDAVTEVRKKIDGFLEGLEDPTLDDAYEWIKGIFGAAVGGFVFSQVKEEIEDLFFPVGPSDETLINCADYDREGGQVADVNQCGDCFEKGVEPGEDGRCRRVIKDDFEDDDDEVDLFGVETTCKREGKEYNELLDECGDCIKEGYAPGADGVCAPVGEDGGTDTGTGTTETKCDDPNANNYGEAGACTYDPVVETCDDPSANNYGEAGDCTYDPIVETCDDPSANNYGEAGDCTYDPVVETCDDPSANNYGKEGPCTYDPIVETCDDPNANNYGEAGACTYDPVVETCDDPSATNYGKEGPCTYGPTVTKCEDPNALNTGQDGPCRYDTSDPCLSADYAAANPTECGTAPLDCSDPAYASANPDECGTTPPPPETPSGGGGGGGGGAGGASGMFDLESFEITGDPQLLAKMEFPITDFLSGSMFKDYV